MAQWIIKQNKRYVGPSENGLTDNVNKALKFDSRKAARENIKQHNNQGEIVIKFEPKVEVVTVTNNDKIEQCKKDIRTLEDNLAKLQEEKKAQEEPRYYQGQHFFASNEYVLVRMGTACLLVDVKHGTTKDGAYKCTWQFDEAKSQYYITGLPTLFPSDFGTGYKRLTTKVW